MSRVETLDQDDVERGAPGLVAAKPGAPAAAEVRRLPGAEGTEQHRSMTPSFSMRSAALGGHSRARVLQFERKFAGAGSNRQSRRRYRLGGRP
jgi:hypothetical protein